MLLLVINDHIPSRIHERSKAGVFYETSLHFIDGGRLLPLSLKTVATIARLALLPGMPSILRATYPADKELARQLDSQVGRANRELLMKGGEGLKLYIVINSPGGAVDTEYDIVSVMKWVKLLHGKVTAYAFRQASSAAANIFAHADIKYALRKTHFLCHPPLTGEVPEAIKKLGKEFEPDPEMLKRMDHEEFEYSLRTFFKGARPEFAGLLNGLISNALKTEGEIVTCGSDLEKYGLVQKAYLWADKLIDRLEADTGIDLNVEKRLTAVLYDMEAHYILTEDKLSPDDKLTERFLTFMRKSLRKSF